MKAAAYIVCAGALRDRRYWGVRFLLPVSALTACVRAAAVDLAAARRA
jgi:hypothetical protein